MQLKTLKNLLNSTGLALIASVCVHESTFANQDKKNSNITVINENITVNHRNAPAITPTQRPTEFILGDDGVVKATQTEIVKSTPITSKINIPSDVTFNKPQLGSFNIIKNPAVPIAKPTKQQSSVSEAPKCGQSPATVQQIIDMVKEEANRQNVDISFALAITRAESVYDRVRNSDKGARGPMQLIPATAKRFGVKDVCDPKDNIRGGVTYLKWLLEKFQNPIYAAAAYNAGEGRIAQYDGVPPFKETLDYVAKVIKFSVGPIPTAESLAAKSNQSESSTVAVRAKKRTAPSSLIKLSNVGKKPNRLKPVNTGESAVGKKTEWQGSVLEIN